MSIERCIRDIIDETQTTLPKEDVAAIVEMLIQYDLHPRNRQTFGPFSPEQGRIQQALENATPGRLMNARDTLIARARLVASQQAANVVMNAVKRAERYAVYSQAVAVNPLTKAPRPDVAMGFQAKLIGTNTPFFGSRDSTAAAIEGNTHQLVGAFDQELKAAGLDRLFASGAMERQWALELFELNRRGGTPGITGSPQAQQIAQIIHNTQRRGVEMLNAEGAFIGSYDGYIARSSHSAHRLIRMGEDAWVANANQYFDLDLIYPNRDPAFIDRALRAQFKRIASGLHDSYDPAELDLTPSVAGQNMATKVSERRVIHFKDADSWLAYNRIAGDYTPTQIIFKSAVGAARDAALMRIWGTNPKQAFETDFIHQQQLARDAGDFETVQRLNNKRGQFDNWMAYMTGEANQVVNETAALVTQNVLSVQRMAKLGFLPLAQLTDLASIASELKYQGVGFVDRISGGILQGYFRGGMNSEKRQVADLLNAYLEGELSQYGMMMETNDPNLSGTFTGTLNQMQQWFFQYTGATAMTNRARGSLMYMMARHWGTMKNQAFGALGAEEQRMMRAFGIGGNEWEALNQAPWMVGTEGNTFLTPRDAMAVPDYAIDNYNTASGQTLAYHEFREDMAQRLYALYADRMDYGVLNPGVGERALLYQGGKPGSALGTTLRLITQFKTFMVAQLRKTWGREIYGQPDSLGSMSGLIQFAMAGTALGITSNFLTQLLKGQDPTSQWEANPALAIAAGFTRAGSASVIGDFLFSDFNRHGTSIAAYALGPTVGNLETFGRMYSSMVRGENPAGDALTLTRSMTPFTNLFYTKMATDYLIWNGLTEWANPNYLKRVQKNLKKNQGIEFMGTPSPVRAITGSGSFAPNDFRAF